MNEHEIERIAAAMNQLRPDWPVASLRTMLRKPQLADRPRRDVTVALAWVACEAGTATPARVLEAGPWWQAAGVEGGVTGRHHDFDRTSTCANCSLPYDRCRALWDADHEFVSIHEHVREVSEARRNVPRIVDELRGLRDATPVAEPSEAKHEANPHVEQLRIELARARTDATQEEPA